MVLAEGTTNLMQRLARLPKAPDVNSLRRRKPVPPALSHNHHLHIRWCYIDRLRPPDFSGTSPFAAAIYRLLTVARWRVERPRFVGSPKTGRKKNKFTNVA